MLPSTTVIKGGYVYDTINLTSSIYSVINILRLFLGQISKDKPTLLLPIKTYSFDVVACNLFYTKPFFSVQYLFSVSAIPSH